MIVEEQSKDLTLNADDDYNENDDNNDYENSIEKIKAAHSLEDNDDDDNNSENSRDVDEESINSDKLKEITQSAIFLPEPQKPFQPSSTPKNFEPRCLVRWNSSFLPFIIIS